MARRKVDPRCTQALRVMRNLMSQGWHEESLLVDAATAAIDKPGTEGARIIAQRVFDMKLKTTEPN